MNPDSSLLITGGVIVNPSGLQRADVLVRRGVVEAVGGDLKGDVVLEADGQYVSSGFVDLHTHLREPGREEAETIESGCRAAVRGGYTAIVAMPNTDPPQDNAFVVGFVANRGREVGLCEVLPAGCITIGRAGERLAPFGELAALGVRLFTDDGSGVQDPLLMRTALEQARGLGITLAQHCEVSRLTEGAVMHEGECCSRMGVPGWPALAEELMVHRDIELVRLTGSSVHLLHLSTAGSVDLVRRAKADGLAVTAEVTPHHLSLTDDLLGDFDPVFKVNPPLRTSRDIEALRDGVRDGTIDAVATDHAPHSDDTKELPLDEAPPGMLGLETALSVLTTSVGLDPVATARVMSWNPARIAGIDDRQGRPIAPGEPAHLAVWDLTTRRVISRDALVSRSRNTPWHGMELAGAVRHTVYQGQVVMRDGEVAR